MKKTVEREDLIQKLINDEARRLGAGLERKLEQRTAELEAVQSEMGAFAYCVSHDLRAPLIHIGGFVDLLLNHPGAQLDETGQRYLKTIAASATRMGEMIEDVHSLSRVSAAELQKVSIDLDILVRDVIEKLRPQTTGRGIQWTIGPLPTIEADPTLLRTALVELIGNALKFTRPREEARIQIGARRETNEVIVTVRDNGVGFDTKYREKLFGVFQRLHAMSEFEGSGVGLSRARRIIQRHGGRMWAESVPGAGAEFSFSLPEKGTV